MSSEPAIAVSGLEKVYRIYDKPFDRLKQTLFGGQRYREFRALDKISFSVEKGKALAVLGPNGAGKSTLLQIVAGTLAPSAGTVTAKGRVAALLELGSGFNPEFTGRENVILNGAILGIDKKEMERRFAEIVAFAEMEAFVDQPAKTYSSGMYMRLAFAVAISVSPDVLIVDEALSVGDVRFQARCASRIRQMREHGVTILFVTHDVEAAKRICDDAIVLERGKVVRAGAAAPVANWYLAHMIGDGMQTDPTLPVSRGVIDAEAAAAELGTVGEAASPRPENADFDWLRHGDGNAEILRFEVRDAAGKPTQAIELDREATFVFDVRFLADVERWGLGFYIRDRLGTDVIGVNTFQEGLALAPAKKGDIVRLEFTMPLSVRPGAYGVSPAVAYSQEDLRFLDWIHNAVVFRVVDPRPKHMVFGLYHPPVVVSVSQLSPAP